MEGNGAAMQNNAIEAECARKAPRACVLKLR
jgi:hypothetical protein